MLAGSNSDNGSGAARIYSSRIEFDVDTALVTDGDDLIVGLLDPVGSGDFDTLRFRILREGATVLDQSFGDFAAALAYFGDHALDFGALNAGLSGDGILDLDFLLDYTTGELGAGFAFDFIAGNGTAQIVAPPPGGRA